MVSRVPCKEHVQCTQCEGLVFFEDETSGSHGPGSYNIWISKCLSATVQFSNFISSSWKQTCGIMWNYETHMWNYVDIGGIRPYAHFLHSGYWYSLTIHTEEVPWTCVEWNETSTHSSPSWNHHDFGTRFYQGTTVLLLPWKLAHRRERVQCPPVYCSKNVNE